MKDDDSLPDVLLDLLRAATLLTSWLWGQSRQTEGLLMSGKSVRWVVMVRR